MMTRRRVTGGSAVALMTAAVVLSPTAADAASPAKTTRTVEHDVTLPTQIGEDERCGLGRIAETQFNRLQMNQLTRAGRRVLPLHRLRDRHHHLRVPRR